ncbi:hypothetical protein GF407_14420 [candidate division KSB1 bacterium]|nr:hypothetical protein [candidate division KSB1 bacterium]
MPWRRNLYNICSKQKGYDPYAMMVDTLRNHDIMVMANIRMNDHHGRLLYWTPWERQHKD